jgi:uncharacterized membrane protein YhhN
MMPFPGGLAATANGTLLLSTAAAFLYLVMVAQPISWQRSVVKTAAVGLLALLVAVEGGPWVLVVALALSALGDAFLSQEGERNFLAGLTSFLAAHIAYVALFAMAGNVGLVLSDWWRAPLAAALAVFAGAMVLRLRPALPAAMVAPVAAYVVAILIMGLAALTLPAPLVIAGAVLFILSDGILATERFLMAPGSAHRRWTAPAVWSAYYAGQLAITLGVLLA